MAVTVIANIDTVLQRVLQTVRDVMMEIQNIDTERAAVIDEIEIITMPNVQGITNIFYTCIHVEVNVQKK
jgi:hypothetical protein